MGHLKISYVILIGVVCLLFGLFLGWFIDMRNAKIGEFIITDGTNKVSIKLDQEKINDEKLLKEMFSSEWTRDATKSWLKKYHGIFHFRDVNLSDSIAKLVPTKIKDKYLCNNLVEISRRKEGPWAYKVNEITIGYPKNPPPQGKAYACETGDYYRKKVKLRTLDGTSEVLVEVSGRYECPDGWEYPEIQISKEDKEKLFDQTPFGKTEKVFALILND